MGRALVVTGTGTGVGKTVVTATLAARFRRDGLRVAVRKPFATGIADAERFGPWRDDDAALLAVAADSAEAPLTIRPVSLSDPLAPADAARLAGVPDPPWRRMPDDLLEDIAKYDITLVEGVGGVAVPIAACALFSDFARLLGAPALVVASTSLGTVNHSLLTLEHLFSRGIEVVGIAFVRPRGGEPDLAERTGPDLVIRYAETISWGTVPFIEGLSSPESDEARRAVARLPLDCPVADSAAAWLRAAVSPLGSSPS